MFPRLRFLYAPGLITLYKTGRSIRQCQGRWANHLDPSISRSPFTDDEDRAILSLQADEDTAGRWAELLAPNLPGRTADQLRNRWIQLRTASGKTKKTAGRKATPSPTGEPAGSSVVPSEGPGIQLGAASEKTQMTAEGKANPSPPKEPAGVVASSALAWIERREDGSVKYDYGERYSTKAIK